MVSIYDHIILHVYGFGALFYTLSCVEDKHKDTLKLASNDH